MKKLFAGCLLAVLLAVLTVMPALAVTTQCDAYDGSNVNGQDYSMRSSPVTSYLVPVSGGGFMRVQAGGDIEGVLVEYYDGKYNIQPSKTKHIGAELPIFGGFYAGTDAYYILTGQRNPDESDKVEVFRITKYDKNWKRLGSDGIFGGNTTTPFIAGSARMEEYGDYLIIRTAHEMYSLSDGSIHQANVTIQFDTRTMKVTDSCCDVMNASVGYVSHSFNQFVHVEDGHIVALDHGDAYPRSIVLIKYPTDVTTGKFYTYDCTCVDVIRFTGKAGNNTTGASVGAFEISDSSYLIAGNVVAGYKDSVSGTTRNVFVAAVDKRTDAVTVNWLTDYKEGDGTTSTPHMVKLSPDKWLVLWSRDDSVYYTTVDGKGQVTDKTYSMKGELSDCVPVAAGGKAVWYTWDDGTITFYDINLSSLGKTSRTVIENGHRFELKNCANGTATLKCTVCGTQKQVSVPTSFMAWWNTDGSGSYSSWKPNTLNVGDKLYFWFDVQDAPALDDVSDEWSISISDKSKLSCTVSSERYNDFSGCLTVLAPGKVEFTVSPKYNSDIAKTYSITVACTSHGGPDGKNFTVKNARDATCTSAGYTGDKVCGVCGEVMEKGKDTAKTAHTPVLKNAKDATCTSAGYTGDKVCSVCGTVTERGKTIAKKAHTPVLKNAKDATCTSAGYTGDKVCSVCGTVTERAKTIAKTAHAYVNGKCRYCGAAEPAQGGGSTNPPVNDPPADNPPADNPPADNPPADNPPADNPPADNPPADNPPADNPPADEPPVDDPPADDPPADDPPVDDPPVEDPPADEPPVDDPPADDPPADDPPVDDPPADDPPADDPSEDDPPADNPPADEPSADEPSVDRPDGNKPDKNVPSSDEDGKWPGTIWIAAGAGTAAVGAGVVVLLKILRKRRRR